MLLGVAQLVGIRESAMLTAFLAVASLLVNLVLLTVVAVQLDAERWGLVLAQFTVGHRAAALARSWSASPASWLAFSGLESISQIAPALREPRRADRAAGDDAGGGLHPDHLAADDRASRPRCSTPTRCNPEHFLFELGAAFGPRALQLAIVLTAATLLMGAANTAIIGCYHVFLALVRLGFLPRWLAERNRRFNTPHRAIADLGAGAGRGHPGQPRDTWPARATCTRSVCWARSP